MDFWGTVAGLISAALIVIFAEWWRSIQQRITYKKRLKREIDLNLKLYRSVESLLINIKKAIDIEDSKQFREVYLNGELSSYFELSDTIFKEGNKKGFLFDIFDMFELMMIVDLYKSFESDKVIHAEANKFVGIVKNNDYVIPKNDKFKSLYGEIEGCRVRIKTRIDEYTKILNKL